MIQAVLMGALTGSLFGVAVYKSSAVRFSRVLGMLSLTDFKVMKFAFTAVAVASLGYGLADVTGLATVTGVAPRVMPFTGWAHLAGGIIFGSTMALVGFCPGTAFCRAGTNMGVSRLDGWFAILGLFAGVFIYSLVKMPLFEAGIIGAPQPLTLHGWLGIPYGPAAVLVGAFFLLLATLLERFAPEHPVGEAPASWIDRLRGEWHWAVTGTLGGLSVMWASAQGGYVGYSGSVLAIYGWVSHAIGMPTALVPRIDESIGWRAGLLLGVASGAMLAHFTARRERWPVAADNAGQGFRMVPALTALGGGAGLGLGAMIGGGCTSGAFISAFPTLSIGSYAMGGTLFAAAIVASRLRLALAPVALFDREAA